MKRLIVDILSLVLSDEFEIVSLQLGQSYLVLFDFGRTKMYKLIRVTASEIYITVCEFRILENHCFCILYVRITSHISFNIHICVYE